MVYIIIDDALNRANIERITTAFKNMGVTAEEAQKAFRAVGILTQRTSEMPPTLPQDLKPLSEQLLQKKVSKGKTKPYYRQGRKHRW